KGPGRAVSALMKTTERSGLARRTAGRLSAPTQGRARRSRSTSHRALASSSKETATHRRGLTPTAHRFARVEGQVSAEEAGEEETVARRRRQGRTPGRRLRTVWVSDVGAPLPATPGLPRLARVRTVSRCRTGSCGSLCRPHG